MAARQPTREEAEALALQAVAFLAERPREFMRFADLCGLSVEAIKARLADPALLGAVLDYVLASEAMVLEFSTAAAVDPEAPRLARTRLPGAPREPGHA